MIPKPQKPQQTDSVAGVIIAGGMGSRLGFVQKPLLPVGPKTLLQYIVDNACQQVQLLLLNVNSRQSDYLSYGLTIVDDGEFPKAGPLAGILAAMQWIQQHTEIRWLACFPGDTPWFPSTLVQELLAHAVESKADISWLHSDDQLQPLFSLWSLDLVVKLNTALQSGMYSPRYFIESQSNSLLHCRNLPKAMFLNINDEAALAKARALIVAKK